MANKTNRNAQGAGSIRRRPDGCWEARYTVGRDGGTGKQIQRSVYGATQQEVRKKLQQITADIDNGAYTPPNKLSVGGWIDIWISEYLTDIKPHTLASYRTQCNIHIKPAIGNVRLTDLAAPMIQKLYNDLTAKDGLSAKTVKNIHGVLHKALEQAKKIGYIRYNPADACTLPRVTKKDIEPLDNEQIRAFLGALDGEPYADLFRVVMFTGMRQGEVLGLSWDNVDFEKGVITISRQLQKSNEKGVGYYFETLKNNKTRRIVPAPYVMEILDGVRLKQSADRLKAGAAWKNDDPINYNLVFTNELGEHLKHVSVYKHYKKIAAKIGAPNSRFHDLRHTYAVVALANGDNVKNVQEALGHSTAAFTLDVYGHVTDKMKRDSAARMEKFIEQL